MTDTIAADVDEYVQIAVRLGTEPGWRDAMRARSVAGLPLAYDDREVVEALARFLPGAVEARGAAR